MMVEMVDTLVYGLMVYGLWVYWFMGLWVYRFMGLLLMRVDKVDEG